MEFCALCGAPCISDKHYRVVDVKDNKAVKESTFCQSCGLTYIQAVFQKPSAPPKPEPKKIPVKSNNPIFPKVHIIKTPEELLSVMMGMGIVKRAPEKPKKEGPCPACGLEIEEFIKNGKFGCPKCYSHYQETFFAMADMFQNGANKHVGKQPKNFLDVEEKDRLKLLKLKMASAVEKEQYEEAARIRNQIRALEEENRVDSSENEQQA